MKKKKLTNCLPILCNIRGFRGADPSEYYGDGIGTYDFTRMQLYRDVNVYKEVARRAKIVCADTTASIGDFMSIDDWKTKEESKAATRRAGRERTLREHMGHLTEKQLDVLDHNEKLYGDYKEKAERCADEGYTTSCFYEQVGKRHCESKHALNHVSLLLYLYSCHVRRNPNPFTLCISLLFKS